MQMPADADTAVDALRPRCCGAFLAHFLCLFPCLLLTVLFALLSSLSSMLFALTLDFLCYIQRHL